MSGLLARILLAILMFPLAAMLAQISFVLTMGHATRDLAFTAASVCLWVFIPAYWLLLWSPSVNWDGRRGFSTALSAGGCALVGAIVGVMVYVTLGPWSEDYAIFVGGNLSVLL